MSSNESPSEWVGGLAERCAALAAVICRIGLNQLATRRDTGSNRRVPIARRWRGGGRGRPFTVCAVLDSSFDRRYLLPHPPQSDNTATTIYYHNETSISRLTKTWACWSDERNDEIRSQRVLELSRDVGDDSGIKGAVERVSHAIDRHAVDTMPVDRWWMSRIAVLCRSSLDSACDRHYQVSDSCWRWKHRWRFGVVYFNVLQLDCSIAVSDTALISFHNLMFYSVQSSFLF